MKKTLLIGLAIIVAVVGFLIFTKPAEETAGTPSEHKYSEGTSGHVLVEYGDFQCTGCGQYYPTIKQVKETYKDTITFQWRHLPLESIHTNARAAARAAEAAHIQGKFWEMHDILFDNQAAWSNTGDPLGTFTGYAGQLGLDTARFEEDYRSSAVNAIINADMKEFEKTGAQMSTPTFFFNGEHVENPVNSVEFFSALFEEALGEQSEATPQNQTENQPEQNPAN